MTFVHKYYFFIVLFIMISGALMYVTPQFPGGVVQSYRYSLAVAADNHLVFGKDIIYTFGPLSTIYTGFYSFQNHLLSELLSFFLIASLSFFIYKLFEKSGYLIKLLLIVYFFVNVNTHIDFFFILLPALAALFLINSYSKTKLYLATVLLFGFISALLLLVKLSFGVEAFIDLALLLVFYAIKKDIKSCLLLVSAFSVFFTLLYAVSGQGISNIFYYPLNIYYGVAGYNDSMSCPGPFEPVAASAFFLVCFIAYLVCRSLSPFNLQRLFSVFVIFLLSLVVFKHGFVRNDIWHSAGIYMLQLFWLIFLLREPGKSFSKYALITVCMLSLLCFGVYNEQFFLSGSQIRQAYSNLTAKAGSTERLFIETENRSNYENSVQSIRNASPLPLLSGTSDIYNYNQAVLLASGNRWNPRPAFQSYQAVTPYLAEMNYRHLLNKDTAPDNIFFRVETIDRRIPTLDDGLSWKALLGVYKPAGWTQKKDYLILKRDSSGKALSVKDSKEISAWTGQEIDNPFEHGLVFFSLHMSKSLPGKLLTVVYKTDPVWMKIKLQNGQEKNFRIIPSMSGTGFLLSPLILNTVDFAGLYKAGYFPDGDIGMRVKSLTILPESPYQYSDSIDVTFEQLELPDRSKALVQKLGSRKSLDLKSVRSDPSVKFNVDSFSYRFTDDRRLLLGVRGWSFRKNVNIKNSSYSLIFAGQDGNCFEIPLSNAKRDDVTKYFKDGHNYDMSGFQTYDLFIDASELKGKTEYKVYLEMTINGASQIVQLGKTMNVS